MHSTLWASSGWDHLQDDQAANFRWMRKEKPNGCVWWAVVYSQIIVFYKIRFHLHGTSWRVRLRAR